MIQQNTEQLSLPRALRRQLARQKARHGKENTQSALNALLWKIIMQNGGALNIPCSDLKGIPGNMILKATYTAKTDTLTVVAGTQGEKRDIIVANNGLIL